MRRTALLVATTILLIGCQQAAVTVPGDTPVAVRGVSIVAAEGASLSVDYSLLKDTLGLRKGSLLRPARNFNPFRLAEDRRRVETHAKFHGHFEATVDEPLIDRKDGTLAVTWTVNEGPRYKIGALKIVGAPAELEAPLLKMIPFGVGDAVVVNKYRPFRRDLAERLQSEGYGHARVYSRAWLDRSQKTVEWVYFVDAGPQTTIGTIEVVGNVRVPGDVILARSGLKTGAPYSTKVKKRAELALLDGGSLRSVVVRNDADILAGPPQWPDTGGTPALTATGDMAERSLDRAVNLRLVVVEAPRRELRLEVGAEVDPARFDAFAGFRTLFRDVGGARNHVVVEGSVGYGIDISDSDEPLGVYGEALLRYVRAGAFSKPLDFRLSARLRHRLFPGASVQEVAVGPGLRAVLADNLFVNVDLFAAGARTNDFGPFDAQAREQFSLAEDDTSTGAKLETSLTYDVRNDRIEATRGHLVAGGVELSPGGALSSHRALRVTGDLRKFFPVTETVSIGARTFGAWTLLATDDGLPLASRLFGGGAYGFRGLGRQELSPSVDGQLVGGESLAEASLEARFLPFRVLYGAVAFIDFAGVGAESNPLADGLSGAVGLGARARSFFVPIAIDVSYRVLEENEWLGPGAIDRWSLFFRIGEAF